ncbi:hypothetical protein [Desertivibrio insolitus]|uniref:hypothetical protein n=1 Tax=Herbiconiux sp. SYSU D00978 TaxID=2812562 RepID=UPI0027DD4B6E|nr:hypothetical protein [Herbiconiux sp. SYSU D00978]
MSTEQHSTELQSTEPQGTESTSAAPRSSEQERYQVRFEWGLEGAAAVASDADVLVWVDGIPTADVPVDALPAAPAIVRTGMPEAAAVARWLVDLQQRLGSRTSIAIVAAGEQRDGGIRFAVEDLLVAGAVIDALAALGLDATSPEAAAAEGAYRHLQRAVAHLFTASTTAVQGGSAPAKIDPSLGAGDVEVLRPHTRDVSA